IRESRGRSSDHAHPNRVESRSRTGIGSRSLRISAAEATSNRCAHSGWVQSDPRSGWVQALFVLAQKNRQALVDIGSWLSIIPKFAPTLSGESSMTFISHRFNPASRGAERKIIQSHKIIRWHIKLLLD